MLWVFIASSIAFVLLAFAGCMGLIYYSGGMANGPLGQLPAAVKRLNTLFIAPALAAPICLVLAIWGYVGDKGYMALGWYLAWVAGTMSLFQWVHAKNRRQQQ